MTRQKIAILGGGMAALATAFELTERRDLQDRLRDYDLSNGLAPRRKRCVGAR